MYSFAAVSFGTGSTTATTTSPPAYAPTQQIQQRAALLRLSDRALLTTLHRPGSAPSSAPGAPPSPAPTRPAATSEPPAKRIRLDSEKAFDDRLLSCMRRQVFPHVDAELATLPRNRVSVLAIGKQVGAIVFLSVSSDLLSQLLMRILLPARRYPDRARVYTRVLQPWRWVNQPGIRGQVATAGSVPCAEHCPSTGTAQPAPLRSSSITRSSRRLTYVRWIRASSQFLPAPIHLPQHRHPLQHRRPP